VRYIAIRAAGYDNVHLETAHRLAIKVANVPAYSPYAIAEHAVAMMLALNRNIVLADRQVHQHNFAVGKLIGFDMHGKTVGIIGTGKIGGIAARILHGFGCKLLGYDISANPALESECGLCYVSLEKLYADSHIITLHTPFSKSTAQLINRRSIGQMRSGVMLINTARGGVVNTADVIEGLRGGRIGAYGADVYERERGLFFYDHSAKNLDDPLLLEMLSIPNVLITPHQAFATHEALGNIAENTFFSLACWNAGKDSPNEL
jgi:D-lactate dehydrogenase